MELYRERAHASNDPCNPGSGENQALEEIGSAAGLRITWHSGLPLSLCQGKPIGPRRNSSRTLQLGMKRAFDILTSFVTLIFFAPALFSIALAIRLTSPGPSLFRQTREGRDGVPIDIYKFRTIYSERCDDAGTAPVKANDARVTPLGRFLRRTSIDEMPQLLNVLKGEMSLIGPRPHVFGVSAAGQPYDLLVPYYRFRQAMKPGLTGWAQAHGLRGHTEQPEAAQARIDHDCAYIENFSLALDFKIIWKTLRHEFPHGTGM